MGAIISVDYGFESGLFARCLLIDIVKLSKYLEEIGGRREFLESDETLDEDSQSKYLLLLNILFILG